MEDQNNESYLTKSKPTFEDWLAYNHDFFARLRGEEVAGNSGFAPLTDVDRYADEAGMSVEDYFEQIRKTVGPLGRAGLQLAHSSMDDAYHVVIAPSER